uniref:Uncharacterized protein n=1 Tax=Lepeophtheirus salmonis TaxID=72036 RepID=A0A0K2UHR8_LEPSM
MIESHFNSYYMAVEYYDVFTTPTTQPQISCYYLLLSCITAVRVAIQAPNSSEDLLLMNLKMRIKMCPLILFQEMVTLQPNG